MSLVALLPSAIFALLVFAAILGEACHLIYPRGSSDIACRFGWSSTSTEIQLPIERCTNMDPVPEQKPNIGECLQPRQYATKTQTSGYPRHRLCQSTNDARLTAKRPLFNPTNHDFEDHTRLQTCDPSSPTPTPFIRPSSPVLDVENPNMLLTALASQERRVMELREELKKAENDLAKLKERWMAHEVIRKRDELIRHSTPLRSMSTPLNATSEADGIFALEHQPRALGERRRTLQARPRPTQRRFEGGKHARALSLLSVNSLASHDDSSRSTHQSLSDVKEDLGTPIKENGEPMPKHGRTTSSHVRREEMVTSGKQFVGDLRDGLWTFIEDLKQATVGDEAISGTRARQAFNTPSKPANLSCTNSGADVRRNGSTSKQSRESRKRPPNLIASGSELKASKEREIICSETTVTEDWDNWDSPPPNTGSSIFDETSQSTPRTSSR
jgi:Domain of unknown function (DUF4048)